METEEEFSKSLYHSFAHHIHKVTQCLIISALCLHQVSTCAYVTQKVEFAGIR